MTPQEARARQTEVMRQWRAANPERDRENWQRQHSQPGYRAKQSEYSREVRQPRRRIHGHGLTPEEFAQLVEDQDGRCYLCNELLDAENQRRIHIDHDHSCCRGRWSCGACVRGIACAGCNKAIARYGDSPERMEQAAAALRAANERVAARRAVRSISDVSPVVILN